MASPESNDDKPVLMPHSYDGIQEFDQSLPNWWLFTLFGSIIFSALYWAYYFHSGVAVDDHTALDADLSALEAKQLAAVKNLDDETLWKMSRNAQTVTEGQAVYASLCITCHGPTLAGIKGLGFRLNDTSWVHGNTPTAIFRNISEGIVFDGKPTGMAPQKALGTAKLAAVTAFLLSTQEPGKLTTIARSEEPSQK
jgi:cytochrome c oxidase cbb3-type subunit 3